MGNMPGLVAGAFHMNWKTLRGTVDGQGNAEESDDSRHQQKVAPSVLLGSEESIGHFAGGVVQRRQRYESGLSVLSRRTRCLG